MIDWPDYRTKFISAAKSAGMPDDYVLRCLDYASPLADKGLPIIYDGKHLCRLVGYEPNYVYGASNAPGKYYRRFTITKRSGGRRELAEPLPSLKEIQRWIAKNILSQCESSKFAKGFVEGQSIRSNARFHRAQPTLVCLNIKDFFPSTGYKLVRNCYQELGYSRSVVELLTKLSLLDGGLPQGAPTSPALSNLILARFDEIVGSFAVSRGWRYTRYVDDLCFSGEVKVSEVIRFVRESLATEGYRLNAKKTRVMSPGNRQIVTGIIVNKSLNAPREIRRQIRQFAYFISKYGEEDHLKSIQNEKANSTEHYIGLCNYVLFLNPKDRDARSLLEVLRMESYQDAPMVVNG